MAKTKKATAQLAPVVIDLTFGPPTPNPAHVNRGQPVIWKVNARDALQITFHDGNSPLGWSQGLGHPGDGLRGTVRMNAAIGTYPYRPTLLSAFQQHSGAPGPVIDASDPEIVVDGGNRGGIKRSTTPARAGKATRAGARKHARKKAPKTSTRKSAKKKVTTKASARKKAAKKK